MRLIPLLLLLGTSGCLLPKHPVHYVSLASSASGVWTTKVGLDKGAVEKNKILGSHPSVVKLASFQIGGWIGIRAIEEVAERKMKRKFRFWERLIVWSPFIAWNVADTVNNIHVINRLEKK